MQNEKRKGKDPIPVDTQGYLNDFQLASLKKVESYGVHLKYIRRPLFQDPVVIVTDQDEKSVGVLNNDGNIDMESGIILRE